MKIAEEIKEKIEFINISKYFSTGFEEYFNWTFSNLGSKFRLDILSVQDSNPNEKIFYQIHKKHLKICYFLKDQLLYIIGAKEEIEFQLLEALIEEIIEKFKEYYINKIKTPIACQPQYFQDFKEDISNILLNVGNKVKTLIVFCEGCNKTIGMLVKKSIIEQNKEYPIPFVFNHKGHGLLVYIDSNFNIRGSEIVISSS